MQYKSYGLGLLFFLSSLTITRGQEPSKMALETYFFEWIKANGDEYEIPIENNLDKEIFKNRLDRVFMQVLLKAVLKSRNFETFIPEKVSLFSDENNNVLKLDFSFIDARNENQKKTHYYKFDYNGNLFNQIE
jgi:hypothetical protein